MSDSNFSRLSHAKAAIDVQLVDSAVRPDHFDGQIGRLLRRSDGVALVRLDSALLRSVAHRHRFVALENESLLLGVGFEDSHTDGLVQLAANPYAAMPSLHAADSLIVGLVLALLCRRWWSKLFWTVWPAWVWFAVMATGNHFWLDILAGILVAAIAGAAIYRRPLWRRLRPAPATA